MRPDPAAPRDLRELDYAEHLIIWSFRAIASGRWECPVIRREYKQAFGARAEQARHAIRILAVEIARRGRRTVALGAAGILGVTRDEQQLLAIYAAAQQADEPRFSAHMAWLLGRPGDPLLYRLARLTAEALAERGHQLAPRSTPSRQESCSMDCDRTPETFQRQVAALAPAEDLLLCSLRGWAAGRLARQRPHQAITAALTAKAGGRVAALFLAWVQGVEAASLRPLQAECAHCGGISPDLQRLVAACGLAPVAFELAERLIEPLVSDSRMVVTLARALNAALASAGWPVPARLAAEPRSPGSVRTLH